MYNILISFDQTKKRKEKKDFFEKDFLLTS